MRLLSLLGLLLQINLVAATLTPVSKEISGQAAIYSIQVDGPDWLWKIEPTESWLSVSRSTATGDATIDITVDRNDSGLTRTAVVKIDGLHHSVTQYPSESGRLELWAMGSNKYGQLGDGRIFVSERHIPFPLTSEVAACALGMTHTLFLKKDKTLWSLGGNSNGQLGQPGPTTFLIISDEAAQVASDVVAISAGYHHSLYLKSDGSLWGMGDNLNGQLGDGTAIDRSSPIKIATGVTAIAAGGSHSLFLKTDGSLWAMGYNEEGQLGIGTTQSRFTPTRVATSVTAISAGESHSLFIKSDRTLWAMGRNAQSQLGDGTTVGRTSPVQIASKVTRASAGSDFSVFVDESGKLYQTGNGYSAPQIIESGVSSVIAGYQHLIYTKNDGSLWGAGRNYEGQLASDHSEANIAPTKIADNVKNSAAGGYNTTYITQDDTLWVCGSNEYGQLGISMTRRLRPIHIMSDVVGAAPSATHTLFIKANGAASAVGNNAGYVLGDGTTINRSFPVYMAPDALTVAAGSANSFVLQRSGVLLAVGGNQGMFGDGTRLARSTLSPIASGVTGIATGPGHTLFLKGDVLWGCGDGTYGQLGDGAPLYSETRLTPVQITQNVAGMSAGAAHSMVIKKDGSLWGTGENSAGQLGDGTQTMRNTLVQVATDVSAVSAGGYFTIFLKTDGTLWGMGDNVGGALGGTATYRTKPVKLAEDVTQIAAGSSHYLFIKRDRSLWACGSNAYGQLGDGSAISSAVPIKIAESVVAVAAGHFSSFFTTLDKTPPPQISLQPTNLDVVSGQAATFRATATGTSLSYQWYYGASGDATHPIPGATSPLLRLEALAQDVAVWVRVTNPGGSVDSVAASALVYHTQTIDFAPLPNRYIGAASFELQATASNGGPVSFSVSGPASLQGNLLVLGYAPGVVTVVASAPASGRYLAATLERRFYLQAIPTLSLALGGLNQAYDGTPRRVTVSGGIDGIAPVVTYDGSLTPPVEVGTYAVEALLGANVKKGTLSVHKRPLSVSVQDRSRAIRQPNPAFSLAYSGFADGDGIDDLDHLPEAITKATISSPPGVYPITIGQGMDNNYEFVLEHPGALTILGFGGTYETLLSDPDGVSLGKLELTVAANALTYTGALHLASEPGSVTVVSNTKIPATVLSPVADGSAASATWTRAANPAKTVAALSLRIDLAGDTLGATLTRGGLADLSGSGARVFTQPIISGKKQNAPWIGAHTLVLRDPQPLDPAPGVSLPAPGATPLPLGAGHASATVAATGVMSLKGKLADGVTLTSTAKPDAAGGYRVFVKPYGKRLDSFVSGPLALQPHPDQTRFKNRHFVAETDGLLFWAKAPLPSFTKPAAQDKTYRQGFAADITAALDPWIAPNPKDATVNSVVIPAGTLVQRLGLGDSPSSTASVAVAFTLPEGIDFGTRASFLPGPTKPLALSAKGAFTVSPPLPAAANNPAFTLTVTPATGAFSGSFILLDQVSSPTAANPSATKPITRKATISGTLRQGPDGGATLGHAHVLLDPVPGDIGPAANEQISGELILAAP